MEIGIVLIVAMHLDMAHHHTGNLLLSQRRHPADPHGTKAHIAIVTMNMKENHRRQRWLHHHQVASHHHGIVRLNGYRLLNLGMMGKFLDGKSSAILLIYSFQ